MIPLDAELQEPEACVGRRRERAVHGGEDGVGAERRERRAGPQRDVHGTAGIVRAAAAVRHGAPVADTRAPGAAAAAAPGTERERELPCSSGHLEYGIYYPS